MRAGQWKKTDAAPCWPVSVRGSIALHDTGGRWDDGADTDGAMVDALQCGRLYMALNATIERKIITVLKIIKVKKKKRESPHCA